MNCSNMNGLHSFGSALKLLPPDRFSFPFGLAIVDEGRLAFVDFMFFEFFFGIWAAVEVTLGWLWEFEDELGWGTASYVSSTSLSSSSITSETVGVSGPGGEIFESTHRTSFILQRGYCCWNVTISLKFSLTITSWVVSVERILEKWVYKSLS